MEIRTSTILRLRDALLQSGHRKSPITTSAYRTLIQRGLLTDDETDAIARVAPFAESMFLVIAADEQVTDTELTALRGAIRGLAGDVLSDEILIMLMEKYARLLLSDGLQKRLETIAASLDDTERPHALALSAAVALADEQLVEAEDSVIQKMRRAYQLSDEAVSTILGQLAKDS
jgi:uncharacterized tellurite resistance protein B-like protein